MGVCQFVFFSTAFEISHGKEAGALAGCISDLACQAKGALKAFLGPNGISQQLIQVSGVRERFDEFTLQSCLLVDLLGCGIFAKCGIKTAEPDQSSPLAFMPIGFLFWQAGLMRNF